MDRPTSSFKQFHYGLRPSKQVERKVMIEVLHSLARVGCSISEYAYLGFGSVYYVDFVMFHKYLFIQQMVCVEWSDTPKRMKFNKPFKFIKLKLMRLADYISKIRPRTQYLVWLDYDWALDPDMLRDIDGCITTLAPQSIFIVTIDARPRLPAEYPDVDAQSEKERRRTTVRAYNEWFTKYLGRRVTDDDLEGKDVGPLFYQVVMERIRESIRIRTGLQFQQLFHFLYADGAPMLTIGGMIGTGEQLQNLAEKNILSHRFVRTGPDYL